MEILAEGVDESGEALRDMAVAQVFAHDGAVLGFRQAVVVAVPGARLGELDVELIQEFGHGVIDVLRAVVGMKAQDNEGEADQELLKDRQEVGFGEALAGGDDFQLGDAVHGVDVIEPLTPS